MDLTPILKMAFDLIRILVPSKSGKKFLLTLGSMAGIVYLIIEEKASLEYVYAIGGILVAYYLADIICKFIERRRDEKETVDSNSPDSDTV